MSSIQMYAFIALGGASGACLRYFISNIATNVLGKGFPFGTLTVNVIGSFCIGCLYAYIQHNADDSVLKNLLGVGFLGAFTTFSTFSFDTLLLIQQGDLIRAMINVLANVIICVMCVWLALYIFKG